MNSLEIYEFRTSIEKYIDSKDYPLEIKRMIIEEVLNKIKVDLNTELLNQLNEREGK